MAQVTKPYTFANQTTADAGQVNQDFDTLYTAINGNIDGTNIKDGSVGTADLATEAVTPAKTEGLPYAQDILSPGYNGLTVTKDGTNLNQVDVASGVVYIKQADGTLRRFAPIATNFRVSTATNTYYLDFQPDGTWWWNTGHSQQANYINVATVTSDASSNVNVITQSTQPFVTQGDITWTTPTLLNAWTNFGGATAPAGYMKDASKFVHLRGVLKANGNIASGTVLFNLPSGYRPAYTEWFPVVASNGTSESLGVIYINSSGAVTIDVSNSGWMTIDGVTFKAEN